MTHRLLTTYERTLVAAKQAITNMTQAASMLKNLAGTDEMFEHVKRLTRMVDELNSDLPGTCWREVVERDVWGDGDDLPWAFTCRGDEPSYIFAPTEARARELLQETIDEWAKRDVFAYGHLYATKETAFYDVYFGRADYGRASWAYIVVRSHPDAPPCTNEGGHQYDNLVTKANGGGVIEVDKCAHCGVVRTENTWAHHPITGMRGFYTIKFHKEAV